VLLGVLLVGDQLVGEAARAGLELEVLGRESVHVRSSSVVEPGPGRRACRDPL